jgi:hypothetical protein
MISKLWRVRLPIPPLFCVVWGLTAVPPAAAGELSQGWSASPPRAVAPEAVRRGQLVQRHPAGAFGDGVYLVSWCDGSRHVDGPTADIYCARIAAQTGKLLDPQGIVVCSAPDLQEWPEVAFDGTNFLVVWQDFRSGRHYDVYAARVSPEGTVRDRDGFAVATGTHNQGRPDVAYAGGRYLIVWMDARRYPVYGVFAARVTAAGEVLDPQGLALDVEDPAKIAELRPPETMWMGRHDYWWDRLAARYLPAVGASGRQCLVAYARDYPFAGGARPKPTAVLVDPERGEVVAGPTQLTGGAHDTLAVCPTPAGWAVVLMDHAQGWGLAPRLAAVRLDEKLHSDDAFAKPHSKEPDRLPVEELSKTLMPEKTGTLNPGKGAVAFWRPAAAFDGRHVLVASDFGWRARGSPNDITYVIFANRLPPDGKAFLEAKSSVLASTQRADQSVANPALVAGPPGETLLLYEHDTAIRRQVIEGRILRSSK